MQLVHVCPQCGEEFNGYPSQRRKFCSSKCRVAAGVAVKRKTGRMKPCIECGTEFWAVPAREATSKYCSKACKDQVKLLGDHQCVECGKTFKAYPSQQRRYCSQECSAQHKTFRQSSPCEVCGKPLEPRLNQNRFCSIVCFGLGTRSGRMIPCEECGKDVWRSPSAEAASTQIFCSNNCKNIGQRLKGPGRAYTMATGYVYRYYPTHPDASKSGFVAEHRLVMEEKIGRRLKRKEHVHHLNGNKGDNCPENLELMSDADHARVTIREATAKRAAEAAELAAYRERFGPLM